MARQANHPLIQLAQQQKERQRALADMAFYYGNLLGLKTHAHRSTFAWTDLLRNSTYRRAINYFRDSWTVLEKSRGEIFIFVWLGPRDSGKSTIMQAETARVILNDPDTGIGYASETQPQSSKRVVKVQTYLTRPPVRKLFGDLRTPSWAKDEFWAKRPSGLGENPTMYATAPGKASTGYHAKLYALDDVVGRQTNYTPLTRASVIDWFGDILNQAGGNSVIWIIGTMWRGFQLYRQIMEEGDIHKHAQIVIVPAFGAAHDGKGTKLFGEDKYQHFPWLTWRHLEIKRESLHNDEVWRAQYFNEVVEDTALNFEISMLRQGEPPMANGRVDRSKVRIYIVTDTASTTRPSRRASKSVIAVVAKDYLNTCWVLDFVHGMMAPDMFARHFFKLWLKWQPRWYVMENTGPGAERRWLLNEVARRREIPTPPIREVSRWGTQKDSRIQMLFPAMRGNRFYFSSNLPPTDFRINPNTSLANGVIPQAFLRYDPFSVREGRDILDCLADSVLTDRDGNYLCPPAEPPRTRRSKVEETPVAKAIHEIIRGGDGKLVEFL